MTEPDPPLVTFEEVGRRESIRGIGLSHLSIEVGGFSMEDLPDREDRVRRQFERIAPWVRAVESAAVSGRSAPRVSTCLLVDDYFTGDTDPSAVLGRLLPLASAAGLRIDYLGRAAGCAQSGTLSPAGLVAARLLPEPSAGTTGSRPSVDESGWLCNGERSPGFESSQAMQERSWRPPREFASRNHSIFLDVELWKGSHLADSAEELPAVSARTWSWPFLASVWHLIRLGLLRYHGDPVVSAERRDEGGPWPERWDELPAVIQLNPAAWPFNAYRVVSVMPKSLLAVEHAIQLIIDHVAVEPGILALIDRRAQSEGVELPASVADRISNVFVEERP